MTKWWERFVPTWAWRLWYKAKRARNECCYVGDPIIMYVHSTDLIGDDALEAMGSKGTWLEDLLKEEAAKAKCEGKKHGS